MVNDKLFREKLIYFEDIDYTEKIDFVNGQILEDKIKRSLVEFSLEM